MAKKWSIKEDYIVAKYCLENPWAYTSNEDIEEIMLQLKNAGCGFRSTSAVTKRAYDYERLQRNVEYLSISSWEKNIYRIVYDLHNNLGLSKFVSRYLAEVYQPKNTADSIIDGGIFGGINQWESFIPLDIPKLAPSFRDVLEEFIDKFYNENTQHEINKEKKKKLKNKLKSELYNWYINENTFNAIKRGKYPTVTRENVFRICFGLRLSYEESKRLMSSAGHEFRRDEKLDCVVEAMLVSEHPGRYDAKEIEATIYHYTGLSLLTIEN